MYRRELASYRLRSSRRRVPMQLQKLDHDLATVLAGEMYA